MTMNNINTSTRDNFFPNNKTAHSPSSNSGTLETALNRNDADRIKALELTKNDARVSIPQGIKDFSRIKKIAVSAPDLDNSQKIEDLKKQIDNGTYQINYEALADKMLATEFSS